MAQRAPIAQARPLPARHAPPDGRYPVAQGRLWLC